MKCRLIRKLECRKSEAHPDGWLPIGTVIDHWQAYRLVQMGCAVPEDAECRVKAGMSEAQMALAQHAYERVDRGIHPDDYDAYENGYMVGYNPDGSWKPGPNYFEWVEAQRREQRRQSPLIITDED